MSVIRNFFHTDLGKNITYHARELCETVMTDLASAFVHVLTPTPYRKITRVALLSLNGVRHIYRSGIIGRIKRGVGRIFGQKPQPVPSEDWKTACWRVVEGGLGAVELWFAVKGIPSLFPKKPLPMNHSLQSLTLENGSPLVKCSSNGTSVRNFSILNEESICLNQCRVLTRHVYWYTQPSDANPACSRLVLECQHAWDQKGNLTECCSYVNNFYTPERGMKFPHFKQLKMNLYKGGWDAPLFDLGKVQVKVDCQPNGLCTFFDTVTKETTKLQLKLEPHAFISGIQSSFVFPKEGHGTIPGLFCWGSNDRKDLWYRCGGIEKLENGGGIHLSQNDVTIPYLSWKEFGKDKCQLRGITFWERYSKGFKAPKSYYVTKRSPDLTVLRYYEADYDINALVNTEEWAGQQLMKIYEN